MLSVGSTTASDPNNPNKDFIVTPSPSDGISQVAFSPVSNMLIASSWDNQVG